MLAGPQREHLQEILDKMKAQNQDTGANTPPGVPDRSPIMDEVDHSAPHQWGNKSNNIPITTLAPPPDDNRFPRGPPPVWNTGVPPPVQRDSQNNDR